MNYVGEGFVVKNVPFCINFFSSLEGSVGSKFPINLCCDFTIVIKLFNHILKALLFWLEKVELSKEDEDFNSIHLFLFASLGHVCTICSADHSKILPMVV